MVHLLIIQGGHKVLDNHVKFKIWKSISDIIHLLPVLKEEKGTNSVDELHVSPPLFSNICPKKFFQFNIYRQEATSVAVLTTGLNSP